MSPIQQNLIWVTLSYASLVLLVTGVIWRWRTDQFGWTSHSSQWNESHILCLASPLLHLDFLMVMSGHVVGFLMPKDVIEMLGVSRHMYHLGATYLGTLTAILTIVGLAGLIYRRIVVKSMRPATARNDLVMYCFPIVPALLGAAAVVLNQLTDAHGYDYRETISPWLRSVLVLRPRSELMADVPVPFKLHVIAGFLLLAIWPFTHLVHVVFAPADYVTRPYMVYRSREGAISTAQTSRGWTPVWTQGTGNQGANDVTPSQRA